MKNTVLILNLVILVVSTQGGLWDMGVVPIRHPCGSLISLPLSQGMHCNSLQGSVGCDKKGPLYLYGTCQCNLLEDAEYDNDRELCAGKVDAICTAQTTGLFPQKHCLDENAECVPDRKDHTMGTCKCVGGYIPGNRACFLDPDHEGERFTPRPIITVPPPNRGSFKLPKLNLSVTVSFGQPCYPSKLNRTVCNSYMNTVTCNPEEGVCDCTFGSGNHVFDTELNLCAGSEGSYCLARRNILGISQCVSGADCQPDEYYGGTYEAGYSFGKCECLYGYESNGVGSCIRNSIPNPSTKRPIVYPTRRTTTSTTEYPGDGDENLEDDTESDGSMSTMNFGNFGLMLFSSLTVVVNRYLR